MAPASGTPAWRAGPGVDVGPSEPLLVSARRIGHHAWFERRMFEVVGGWLAVEADLDAKLFFGAHAPHHAWRAQVWHDRLPELAEMDRESFIRPDSEGTTAFFDALEAAGSTIERLVGTYRVAVPAAIAACDAHLRRIAAVADGPLLRWIGLVRHDAHGDLDAGGRLLVAKLVSDEDLREASEHEARLSSLLPTDD
ncbi:MAG: hypothetical protein JWM05_777 [Acidimicrobiales bacterium]|nr:hypothetical protein [Acidimicrobiales bacterium]